MCGDLQIVFHLQSRVRLVFSDLDFFISHYLPEFD